MDIHNPDYPDLLCIHIHLASLIIFQIPQDFLASLQSVSVLNTGETIIFRNVTFYPRSPEVELWVFRWTFFLPISINFMTFEKSNFDMKFLSLGHYCMYTSHSLSQIGMDNNNGQIIYFWVSRASKWLNMSTSIKIWILMYYIHLDLDTFYICLDLFGFGFVCIPKYTYHIHLDPKIWQTLSSSILATNKIRSEPLGHSVRRPPP